VRAQPRHVPLLDDREDAIAQLHLRRVVTAAIGVAQDINVPRPGSAS
jgi:hypothetical protein